MLGTFRSINGDNWASLFPLVQLSNNSSFSTTVQEAPFCLMLGSLARLPIDVILGII